MSYSLVKSAFVGASIFGTVLYFKRIDTKTKIAIDNVKLNEIQTVNQRLHDIEVALCKIERFRQYTDYAMTTILLSCAALFYIV